MISTIPRFSKCKIIPVCCIIGYGKVKTCTTKTGVSAASHGKSFLLECIAVLLNLNEVGI